MKTVIAFILLFICTIFNLFGYLPQIIQIIKTKSSDDISISSWLIWIFSETCYLCYVLLESPELGVVFIAVLNLTLIVITSILAIFYQKYPKRKRKHR